MGETLRAFFGLMTEPKDLEFGLTGAINGLLKLSAK